MIWAAGDAMMGDDRRSTSTGSALVRLHCSLTPHGGIGMATKKKTKSKVAKASTPAATDQSMLVLSAALRGMVNMAAVAVTSASVLLFMFAAKRLI
jgi:hypothetical protein